MTDDKPGSRTPKKKAIIQKKPVKAKRMTRLRHNRKLAIQEIVLLDGITGATEITQKLNERGIPSERHSVAEDVKHMLYDDEFWLQALTKSVWVGECRRQYMQTIKAIDRLTELSEKLTIKEMRFDQARDSFEWEKNPYDPHKQPAEYLKFENVRARAYSAYMKSFSNSTGLANIENAISKKQEWIQTFIKELPLYYKLKQLANWVDEHKAKQDIHDLNMPVPPMEIQR